MARLITNQQNLTCAAGGYGAGWRPAVRNSRRRRVGYAPQQTNTTTRDASVALFASGLYDSRKNDRFGRDITTTGSAAHLNKTSVSLPETRLLSRMRGE